MEYIDIFCGQNAEFYEYYVKRTGGRFGNHWDLKG
jgi:hypothetical protein